MGTSVRAIYKIFNFTERIYSRSMASKPTPVGGRASGPYRRTARRSRPLLFVKGERPGGDEVITWGS
jgi:hypothetical protein